MIELNTHAKKIYTTDSVVRIQSSSAQTSDVAICASAYSDCILIIIN